MSKVQRRLAGFHDVRGVTRGERLVLASLAQLAWYRNDPAAEVADVARRAWGDGALLGDTSIEDLPAYQVVYALVMADALADAEAACDQLLAAGSAQGSIITFGAGSGLRAWVRQRRGALSAAAADGAQGLAALRELGQPLEYQQAMTFVGVRGTVEALVARGELDVARADAGGDRLRRRDLRPRPAQPRPARARAAAARPGPHRRRPRRPARVRRPRRARRRHRRRTTRGGWRCAGASPLRTPRDGGGAEPAASTDRQPRAARAQARWLARPRRRGRRPAGAGADARRRAADRAAASRRSSCSTAVAAAAGGGARARRPRHRAARRRPAQRPRPRR